ncbi:hypothetical protein BDW60DRAFT_174216, partial [Aspergillus nidulans var. acristatus]
KRKRPHNKVRLWFPLQSPDLDMEDCTAMLCETFRSSGLEVSWIFPSGVAVLISLIWWKKAGRFGANDVACAVRRRHRLDLGRLR